VGAWGKYQYCPYLPKSPIPYIKKGEAGEDICQDLFLNSNLMNY
jgi:hypothetical protein